MLVRFLSDTLTGCLIIFVGDISSSSAKDATEARLARIGVWIETRVMTVDQGVAADIAFRPMAEAAFDEGEIY